MFNTVAKFGGTSVKTAKTISMVYQIVSKNNNIKAVVVSAVGGVTNKLVQFCNDHLNRKQILTEINNIHIDIISDLDLEIKDEIQKIIKRLEKFFDLQILNKEDIDYILSLGEDLSSFIIQQYFLSQNTPIIHLDARKYMSTNDNFGRADPNMDKIKSYDFPQSLFITQGFIGTTSNNQTTTLGRGGSDFTASILAEAIKANDLLIYTDVPGVYTMDPNIDTNAQPIPTLSFQEMAEMANFGAKILHPATLEGCINANIPVRILSTLEPEKEGTLIDTSYDANEDSCIRAITLREKQILVIIKSLKMLNAYGFLANIFSILSKHKISVDLITTSEVSVALTIDDISMGSHGLNPFLSDTKLLQELKQFAEIQIEEDLTLIAVIGSGLTTPGSVQKIISTLSNYSIRLVCYGASNSSISVLTQKEKAIDMAISLHSSLIS